MLCKDDYKLIVFYHHLSHNHIYSHERGETSSGDDGGGDNSSGDDGGEDDGDSE